MVQFYSTEVLFTIQQVTDKPYVGFEPGRRLLFLRINSLYIKEWQNK